MALRVIVGASEGEMPLGLAMAGDVTFKCFFPAFAEVMGADDDCGRRFPPRDVEALAAAALDVQSAPQAAAWQAEHAQARVRERYTPDRMAGSYLDLYKQLLGRDGQHPLAGGRQVLGGAQRNAGTLEIRSRCARQVSRRSAVHDI